MLKKLFYNRKLMITLFSVIIVLLTLAALGPLIYSLIMGSGVKTEGINGTSAKPASTDVNGDWRIVEGSGKNFTSAGFTFHEVLPAEEKVTSGSTGAVTGQASIANDTVNAASVTVDMSKLSTDRQVRDQNMKSKLFETSKFPEAKFTLTKPVDVSTLPTDGTVGKVELTGDLSIKDRTHSITERFDALRDGDQLVIAGDVPINRLDYNVITPEFVAATIDENGEINLRMTFEKS